MVKYIKSNVGFLSILLILLLINFNPSAKAFLMRGLIRIGLFEPDVSGIKPGDVKIPSAEKLMDFNSSVSFVSADGKSKQMKDLKGKVVFINFWTTWCPPCLAEMPSINALYNKVKGNDNIQFILIDADGNLGKSSAFLEKKRYNLPLYMLSGSLPEEIFSGNLPTTLIINKKGEIVFKHEGMADYDSGKMEKFLNELSR